MLIDGLELIEGSVNSNIVFTNVTLAEKTALQDLNVGEIVYQTDGDIGLYIYNGATWDHVSTATISASGITTVSSPANYSVSTTTEVLKITQTGTGNSFVVEDSTSPDTTPFVVDGSGNLGVGQVPAAGQTVVINKPYTGSTTVVGLTNSGTIQSDVTSSASYNTATLSTSASSFTLPNAYLYKASQGTIGAGSTVTNQYGFYVDSSCAGATNNYGFYGDVAAGAGKYNFYAGGTADNYFGGGIGIGTTSPSSFNGASFPLAVSTNQNASTLVAIGNSTVGAAATSGIKFFSGTTNSTVTNELRDNSGAPYFNTAMGSAVQYSAWSFGGSEKLRIAANGAIGLGGANYGTSGQILTSNGSSSAATWTTLQALPTQTGNSGRYLTTDGSIASWGTSTGSGNVVLSTSPTLVTPNLGTPSAATLTNATGLPVSTGVSGLGTGVATFLATPSSANLAAAVTDETGTGSLVLATSPTLVTPNLGTPSALTLTNATGLPVSTGVSGLGAGVATFLATPSSANLISAVTDETGTGALVFATNPTLVTPNLGTPSAATLTNATGLPVTTGISGFGTGIATFLATPSSANLAAAVTDETGTGSLVLATSPTLVTPILGTPTSGNLTNCTNAIGYSLKSASTTIDVSAATAPTSGQVLTATNGTTATWQTISALPTQTGNNGLYLTTNGTTASWASVTGGATISNDTTTNSSFYPVFTTVTSGAMTTASVSNTKFYFNPSTGTVSATVLNSLSDAKFKTDVTPIENGLDIIKQIEPVEYNWIENGVHSSGVIAQQLETVLPFLVDTNDKDEKSVNYSGIIAYLVSAVQQLSARVEELENN